MTKGTSLLERTMTSSEKRKDTMLKKKYDDSDMKKNMQDQYGKEEGKKVYFATIRKQAMEETAPLAAIAKGAVRAGIKVAGKTGGKVVKTAIKKGGEELKKQAIQTAGEVATNAAKKIGEKTREKANEKIGVREEDEKKEDPSIKAKLERQAMIKKQVLMKKLQAVRAGAGADITSSHEPEGNMVEAKYEKGASDYGKMSIRNKRAVGYGGNAAPPEDRRKAHNERMKKHMTNKGKSMIDPKKNPVTEEVGIGSAVMMKKAREEAMLRLKEKQAVAKKMKKEEVEVVNEVSKKTLGSYVKKAATEIGTSAMKGDYKKMQKRHKGVLDASDKLQKEGAEKSYYLDKESEKRGMEREARRAQNKAAAKERAAAKRRAERNQLRRQGQYGAQGKYYVTKHMEREEVEYTGPNKEDRKQIKKMDNPSYAKKLANYEKNMDPKKRQELKNKAIKGMKFTHEGTSYGLYKGSGKAKGAMKDFLDKKAKMLTKKRNAQSDAAKNNPHFDSTQPSPSGRNKYEEVQRDEYGDLIGGPKISKKQLKKNLKANTPDEQHTTTTSEEVKMLTVQNWNVDDIKYTEIETVDIIKAKPLSEGILFKRLQEKCWDGYKAYGMKKKGGKMVPNCKPVGSVKEETVDEACWKGYEKKGMKTMFGKRYPNCVKKTKKEEVELTDEGYGSDRVGTALKVARAIDKVNPKPKVGSKRTAISNMLKMASIKKDEKLRKQKNNPYSAKNKLKMVVKSISQNARSKAGVKEDYIPEEGYDIARDMGRVPKTKDKKDATTMPPSEEMKKTQKVYKGPSAAEIVKKKYGKAVMNVKKK